MSFSRKTLSLLTVLILVGFLGGGVWWRLRQATAEEGGDGANDPAALADDLPSVAGQEFSTQIPSPVTGAEVVRDTLWITVTAAGRAEAFRRTALRAQVEGILESLPARENSAVAEGAAILQIDTARLALDVAQALSQSQDAELEYRRLMLFDERIEDPEVRRQRERNARARSGMNAAEVRLRQTLLELERATVRAPFEGRVADLRVVLGQYVTPGTELLTVVDLDPIKVEAEVLEAELGLLREGRRGQVSFAAFPGETFSGRIESINPLVDPAKRTGRVTLLLSNPDGRIKPGMYAEVRLDAEAFADRLLVPRSAVLERGEGLRRTMLFVYEEDGDGGLAKWRYVQTGRENDRMVEIVPSEEGTVEPGEVVLVDGHHYLAHDTRVRLVESVAAEGGRPGR
jgi:RND family efflux transporter MFP subunit